MREFVVELWRVPNILQALSILATVVAILFAAHIGRQGAIDAAKETVEQQRLLALREQREARLLAMTSAAIEVGVIQRWIARHLEWESSRERPDLEMLAGAAAHFDELARRQNIATIFVADYGTDGANKRSISVHLASYASSLKGTIESVRADLAGRSPPGEWKTPYENLAITTQDSVQLLVAAVQEALERTPIKDLQPSEMHEVIAGEFHVYFK